MYPSIDPFYVGNLKVSELHSIYIERSGREGGVPVIFLHGGPGSSTNPNQRRYFDPAVFDVILFDQRGCGKSTPAGSTDSNTTWDLVDDVNAIIEFFCIKEKVILFGGSWGSTLALAYASKYSEKVRAMILRGIFLGSRPEVTWFTDGLEEFIPDASRKFRAGVEGSVVDHYWGLVNSPKRDVASSAAENWANYEAAAMAIGATNEIATQSSSSKNSVDMIPRTLVHLHYLRSDCFLRENQLLESASDITVDTVIVQGAADMICPPITAKKLAGVMPNSRLRLVEGAGHNAMGELLARVLVEELDLIASGVT